MDHENFEKKIDAIIATLREKQLSDSSIAHVAHRLEKIKGGKNPLVQVAAILRLYRDVIHPMLLQREAAKLDTVKSMMVENTDNV